MKIFNFDVKELTTQLAKDNSAKQHERYMRRELAMEDSGNFNREDGDMRPKPRRDRRIISGKAKT